jgi:DNA-directed RNA polymerase specialized sigma24 family protein
MTNADVGGPTDRNLLERVRGGDTSGAGELFERYAPALLRFAARLLSDRARRKR